MKLLNSEMKKSTTSFSGNTKSLKSLKEQAALTSDKIDAQKDKINVLRQAVKEASEKYGDADKRTKQWRTSLNNAEAELMKTEKDLKELNAQTTGVGKLKTKFSEWKESISGIKEKLGPVTSGLKNVVSAGAKLAKTSFKAVAAGVAAVGTAAVAAGKKMFDAANATAEYGDEIDKTSQKLGMSSKAYQEWDYVLGQSGVEITSMTTGLKTMTNQIDSAKNGSDKAVDRFARLGISVKDLNSMSREDVFAKVIEGFQGMADSTDRAALANSLFGKSGQNLTPLFNASVESTNALKQAASDLGFVMSDKAVKASANFKDNLDTLKRTFTGVKNNIISELMPGISTLMEGLTGVLSGSADAKDKLIAGAKETVEGIKVIIPKVTEVFSAVIPAVAEIAPVVISELVNGLITNIDPLLKGAVTLITTLVSTLTDAKSIKLIIGAAVNCIVTLTDGLLDNIDQIIDSAFVMIDSLVATLTKKNNLTKLVKASIQIVLKIAAGIIQHVPDLVSAGLQLIKGLLRGLWNNRGMIFNAIKNIGREIINSIKRILGIHSPSSVFSDIGKNLIRGLINGITNAERWVLDKIKGVGSKIVNWAKDALGIHSPSTKFKEIGDFTAQGFGIGFVASMDKVRRQIVKAIPTSFDTNVGVNVGAAITGGRTAITPAAGSSGNVYNFSFDVTVNNNGGDAEDIAEDVSRQLFTQFKRRMEAFA